MLRRGVHTAVCTPGRLKDFLEKRRMNLDICRCARRAIQPIGNALPSRGDSSLEFGPFVIFLVVKMAGVHLLLVRCSSQQAAPTDTALLGCQPCAAAQLLMHDMRIYSAFQGAGQSGLPGFVTSPGALAALRRCTCVNFAFIMLSGNLPRACVTYIDVCSMASATR